MEPHATFVHAGTATTATGSLPPELMASARGRVVAVAALMLVLDLAGLAATLLLDPAIDMTIPRLMHVSWAIVSLAMVAVGRLPALGDQTVLNLGLAYEVGLCLIISLGLPLFFYGNGIEQPHITFVAVVIAVYPMLVPSPPRVTVVVALLAASTAPLGLFVLVQATDFDAAFSQYFGSAIGPLMSVGLAFFGSRVIYGLGRDVARAQMLGAYQLEEPLGAGGMGEVWRATHGMLARPAAIKLIRADLGGSYERDQAMQRFEREAQVTAGLRSPHTVNLYDFGVAGDGRFYYVMELLRGVDLYALVERWGPVVPERVALLLIQACDSLSEAHQQGLVHRDIKPGNLYLCRNGLAVDFIKVLDFGLVRLEDASGTGRQLTAMGSVPGTPAFMPPEVAAGDEADSRSDLYALGAVAYWLLTGRVVFEGQTAMQMVAAHLHSEPVPPTRLVETPIPPAMEALVLRLLAKSPGHRPQTALEVVEILRGVSFDSPWDAERANRWWDLHLPPNP